MVLTRQSLPTLCREKYQSADQVSRGAYVLADNSDGTPDVILMATGSELSLCVDAYEQLMAAGTKARLVSVPSFELFREQDAAYRERVLPAAVTARVACEAGVRQGWDELLGSLGRFIGMSSFGGSAPYQELYEKFGITSAAMVQAAQDAMMSADG